MKVATIGDKPDSVAKYAVAMKQGFCDGGVLAMDKRFLGYGLTAADAYKGTAHITKNIKRLKVRISFRFS